MVPNRILVATDGSESARAAELFAADLASKMGAGASVVVVTVVRPREVPAARGGFNLTPLTPDELLAAKEALTEAEKRIRDVVGDAVTVDSRLLEDRSPASAIAEAAHEGGTCSLVVVGNRGHGGIASLVLGSVSTQVLHHAHCPVLVVRT